jgi:hypothetical protein
MERARKVYGLPSNPARDVEKLRERYEVVTGRGHWGLLRCPGKPPDYCRTMSINGTPRNPEIHARQIARYVARCSHKATDD